MDPNSARVHVLLGQAYELKARFADALKEMQRASELAPDDVQVKGALGHLYASIGRKEDAGKALAALQSLESDRHAGAFQIAVIHTALGQTDAAFEWVDHALQERSEELFYLRVDPHTRTLQADPRFSAIISRLGLPDAGRLPPR